MYDKKGLDMTKIYLGDSVYCEFSLYEFILTTENGFGPSNTIVMDYELLDRLNGHINQITFDRTKAGTVKARSNKELDD